MHKPKQLYFSGYQCQQLTIRASADMSAVMKCVKMPKQCTHWANYSTTAWSLCTSQYLFGPHLNFLAKISATPVLVLDSHVIWKLHLAMTCLLYSSENKVASLQFHMITNWITTQKKSTKTAQNESLTFRYIPWSVMVQLSPATITSQHQLWCQFSIIIRITQLNTKRTKHHMKNKSIYVFTVQNTKLYLHVICRKSNLLSIHWTLWIHSNDFIKILIWKIKPHAYHRI